MEYTKNITKIFDIPQLVQFQADKPFTQILADLGSARVVLFGFKAGQHLPEHTNPSKVFIQVQQGELTIKVGIQEFKLKPGLLLQIEANAPHSLYAETNTTMLLTLAPSPVEEHKAHPSSEQQKLYQ